jgi:cyclophilin family peptidyl-prolyl cis-trans isomerase
MMRQPRLDRPRFRSAALLAAGLLANGLPATFACAQTLTPVSAPVTRPQQGTPATQQSAPVNDNERRFRELSEYIRTRGELDAATRTDLARVATALDADLADDALPRASAVRLLAVRAQAASLLDDGEAMESAFTRLAALAGRSDAVVLAWARERLAFADFEGAESLLAGHGFGPNRRIDADIARAQALTGLSRFQDAQAVLNAIPAQRSAQQMTTIALLSKRINLLDDIWNTEIVLMARDMRRNDLPLVEFVTAKGTIVLELFEDDALNTVGNFIEHVERGTYDGTRFHRVLRGFGVQGGDPDTASGGAGGTGTGGWTIPDEPARGERRALLSGRVLMAAQPEDATAQKPRANSAGCQFMILLDHAEQLGESHAPFGRVAEGLETVRRLGPDDAILSARVLRKRDRAYQGIRLEEVPTGDYTMPRRPGTATRALETRINPPAPVTPPPQPTPMQVQPVDPADISPVPIPRQP